MQTAPGSPFEVIEAKFLLELLMGLLAQPARLDGGGEDFQRRLGRQVREVVLVLACRTALAHEPDLLVAWEVLVRPFSSAGRDAVRDAHPHRRERGSERALGTAPPCDGPRSARSAPPKPHPPTCGPPATGDPPECAPPAARRRTTHPTDHPVRARQITPVA